MKTEAGSTGDGLVWGRKGLGPERLEIVNHLKRC